MKAQIDGQLVGMGCITWALSMSLVAMSLIKDHQGHTDEEVKQGRQSYFTQK